MAIYAINVLWNNYISHDFTLLVIYFIIIIIIIIIIIKDICKAQS